MFQDTDKSSSPKRARSKNTCNNGNNSVAARLGFEPRLRDSESPVLPLYDLANTRDYNREKEIIKILDMLKVEENISPLFPILNFNLIFVILTTIYTDLLGISFICCT